uniref:Uncharacterized protein n=1 Tax=Bicosoecida sp. CB-2014 TaxID=1486930 RepID=A0A7S1CJI1_9STRA|mmetsp:Transcript_3244/g.11736  ORF Transcript_3244/g.11736 Transcript_3244/m.11736 type:complete len:503 (+) Transcript_3244:1079-2587(+)
MRRRRSSGRGASAGGGAGGGAGAAGASVSEGGGETMATLRAALAEERALREAAEARAKAAKDALAEERNEFAKERAAWVARERQGREAVLRALRAVHARPGDFDGVLKGGSISSEPLEQLAAGDDCKWLSMFVPAEVLVYSALLLSDSRLRAPTVKEVWTKADMLDSVAPLLCADHVHVEQLTINGLSRGEWSPDVLREALASPQCCLTSLSLLDIGGAAAEAIVRAVKHNSTLRRLRVLVIGRQGAIDAQVITDSIVGDGSLCQLAELSLECHVDDVEPVCDMVRRSSTLRRLYLRDDTDNGNAVVPALTTALADIGRHCKLAHLGIEHTGADVIDAAAGAALARAIVSCPSLTSLALHYFDESAGGISMTAVEHLSRALEHDGCRLTSLDLGDSTRAIGVAGMARLSLAVQRNASLEDVNVEFEYDVEDDVIELSPLALVHLDNRPRRRVAIAQHFADSATYHSRAAADVAAVASWSAERRVWAAFPRWCVAETIRQVMA